MSPIDHIGPRVKLHDLHVLMTVVQAGSMNKAAMLLNTTQPAVSRSIGQLERTIGIRLLDRGPRGVEPTDCGRALLDGGAAVFDDLRQTFKKIEFLSDPESGEVRVGCNPFLAASFVAAVVDRLSRQHPRVVFQLVAATSEKLYSELHQRSVDFLITRRVGAFADERLGFEFLFDDCYVIAAGAQSPLVHRSKSTLADLTNEPWVLPPPDSPIGAAAREAFRAKGLKFPRVTVVTVPPDVRIRLLATGRFLTILPASALHFPTTESEIRILPVELPAARVPNGIVSLKNRTLSPVARLFIKHAREVAKELTNGEVIASNSRVCRSKKELVR